MRHDTTLINSRPGRVDGLEGGGVAPLLHEEVVERDGAQAVLAGAQVAHVLHDEADDEQEERGEHGHHLRCHGTRYVRCARGGYAYPVRTARDARGAGRPAPPVRTQRGTLARVACTSPPEAPGVTSGHVCAQRGARRGAGGRLRVNPNPDPNPNPRVNSGAHDGELEGEAAREDGVERDADDGAAVGPLVG